MQAKAETVLLHSKCATLEPVSLKVAAARVLEHVDPQLAEDKQRKDLEAADKRAARDRAFTLSPDGTGRVRLSGWLGHEAAAIVNAALDPLCTPAGQHDERTATQRRADALTDVCQLAMATGELPDNGGDRAQLILTMRHDDLLQRIGHCVLDTGPALSPDTVRRIACQANIIPAVLGTTGQVLDLGRQRRLFSGPIRRALILRDGGCAFPGCDRPPRWCDGHHILVLAPGRRDQPEQRRPPMRAPSPAHPPQPRGSPHRRRRPTRIFAAVLYRPTAAAAAQPTP